MEWIGIGALIISGISLMVSISAKKDTKKASDKALKINLLEKRIPIYNATLSLISLSLRAYDLSIMGIQEFRQGIQNASHYYGDEIVEYLNELNKKACKLSSYNTRARGETSDENRGEWWDARNELVDYFMTQHDLAEQKFKSYLKIENDN